MKLFGKNLWIKVVFLLAILSLTLAILSGYLSLALFKNSWERETKQTYSLFLHFISRDVLAIVQHYREILDFTANVVSTYKGSNWDIETFLISVCLKYPSFEWIRYITREGKVLASSEMFSPGMSFVAVLDTSRPISDVLYDSHGEPYLAITVPCRNGYLCGRINLSSIWIQIKNLIFIKNGKLLILDSHNKTVFSTDYQMLFKARTFSRRAVVSFEEKIPQLNWRIILMIELPDFYKDMVRLSLWLWVMIFVLFLLAFWVSIQVSRRWFKPLEKIVPFIREVSRGNLDVYLDITRNDEIGLLVAQVNKMVANLKELKRQSNIQVVGQAISWLGHEIKNYFVPIRAFIDSLPDRHNDKEYVDKMSRLIGREIEKCQKMLQDLTVLKPDVSMEFENVFIAKVVSSVVEMLRPLIQAKSIEVELNIARDLTCWGDREKLKTAILNLLLNAIEVLSEGGSVIISAKDEEGEYVVLEMRDTGPGIPVDIVDRIFEPFVSSKGIFSKTEKWKQRRGLGLAIVYNIIKAHNGFIEFKTGKQGTVFIVYLLKQQNPF